MLVCSQWNTVCLCNANDTLTAHGQKHLHVIVGKGNHSPGHVQKIKPRVEKVCQELGLQYHTESNEGRIYIKLDGSAIEQSDHSGWGGYQQHHQQHQQGGGQYDEAEKIAKKFLPRIINKLLRLLCG